MADWVLGIRPRSVLEPSFGDGVFLDAILAGAKAELDPPQLIGCELDGEAFSEVQRRLDTELFGAAGDFLASSLNKVDAVIGNPPFVRIRNLNPDLRKAALACAERHLGKPMDPSGSTWMPFVLHATSCLNLGGRLAFVLPQELTHVRYARPLWNFLGANFGSLKVVRTHDRLFPDLLQDVLILLASDRGLACAEIRYETYQNIESRETVNPAKTIKLSDLTSGRRAFHYNLLPSALSEKKLQSIIDSCVPLDEFMRIRIGYVSGDKKFFHPDETARKEFRLPPRSLMASANTTRSLSGVGIRTSQIRENSREFLWLPNPKKLSKGELQYIEYGEDAGVSRGYKCSSRTPWFVVPGVEIPDVIVSVFSEKLLMLQNDAAMVASNSLICGTLHDGKQLSRLLAGWYTSITQLFIETEVHSLGGGVLVAVPRELAKVRVPNVGVPRKSVIEALGRALKVNDYSRAIEIGDQHLLNSTDFTKADLERVRLGVQSLRNWRLKKIR